MDSHWFKIWPAQLLTVIGRVPNREQGADLLLVAMTYLNEGGLPNDDAEIAWMTGLPVENITALRPMGSVEDDRLRLAFCDEIISERIAFGERRATAGSQGGKAKAGKPNELNPQEALPEEDSNASAPEALLKPRKRRQAKPSNAKQSQAMLSHTNKQTDNQTDSIQPTSLAGANGASSAATETQSSSRRKAAEPFYTIFCEAYGHAGYEVPYEAVHSTADFVQLANLRKRCDGVNWELSVARWQIGVDHYFHSELEHRTMADLCTRFSVFYRNALNKFGQPVETSNGNRNGTHNTATTHNARAAEQMAQLLEASRRARGQTVGTDSGGT
jgi:hypothetical protein